MNCSLISFFSESLNLAFSRLKTGKPGTCEIEQNCKVSDVKVKIPEDTFSKIANGSELKKTLKNRMEMITDLKKSIKYKISLIFTIFKNWINPKKQPWMSDINENIVLGGIPLENKYYADEFNKRNIDSVLSLIEDFEYKNTFNIIPVKKETWEKKNINFHSIPTKDFLPLSIQDIKNAVSILKSEINKKKKIYVHCKAGKGRSAIVVCCYLIDQGKTADEAIQFVSKKRSNIRLSKAQRQRIHDYYLEQKK